MGKKGGHGVWEGGGGPGRAVAKYKQNMLNVYIFKN